MTIRYYSSLDTGAPALPSVTSQRFFDNLRLILKACLVDGYGAKPAAGWTVGHEHADGFSLSNGEGFINFVNVNSQSVAVYLMEAITDGSTALASGYNRRSGPWFDGQADTARHYHQGQRLSGTYASKRWYVVADERTVTLVWAGGATAVDSDYFYAGALHFGAYRSPLGVDGFCALGGNNSSAANVYSYLFDPSKFHGSVLRNPFDGTIEQGASPGYRAGVVLEATNSVVTNKVLGVHTLRPVRAALMGSGVGISGSTLSGSAASCGLLRGVVSEPALSSVYPSKVLALLGIASPTHEDLIKPITLPNGKQWIPVFPHTSDLGAFVSLDPADWE